MKTASIDPTRSSRCRPAAEQRRHAGPARPAVPGPGELPADDERERGAGADLGDHRRPRRPGHTEIETEHEPHLEHGVDEVGREQDHQRRPVVRGTPQHALGGESEHDERNADGGDAQVGHAEVEDVALAPEHSPEQRCADGDERAEDRSDEDGQPDRLHADVGGGGGVTGAEAAGDPLRRAVGQEVAPGDDEREHRCRQRQTAELRGAESPDDRRVDEHVERLDGEAAEGGDRQADDPPVASPSARMAQRGRNPIAR